jgi:hypothetical protein
MKILRMAYHLGKHNTTAIFCDLIVVLTFVVASSYHVFADDLSVTAIQAVEASKLPDDVKKQIVGVIKASPKINLWSGTAGTLLFGVAVTEIGKDDDSDDKKLVSQNAHLIAMREMLFARPLYESYMDKDKRLKEYNFVRDAVRQVAEALQGRAEITYIANLTPQVGNRFVGIVAVDKEKTLIQFTAVSSLEVVQKAYAGILHVRARQVIVPKKDDKGQVIALTKKDYQTALDYLKEAIPLAGLNMLLQVDAFRCFCALDNLEEAKQFAEQLSKDESTMSKLFGTASAFNTKTAETIKKQLETKIRETENDNLVKEYFGK